MFFTIFGLRGSKIGSPGMILSAIEAELHKDSIFNLKTYYFGIFDPILTELLNILGGSIVENSKISPNKRLGPKSPAAMCCSPFGKRFSMSYSKSLNQKNSNQLMKQGRVFSWHEGR